MLCPKGREKRWFLWIARSNYTNYKETKYKNHNGRHEWKKKKRDNIGIENIMENNGSGDTNDNSNRLIDFCEKW